MLEVKALMVSYSANEYVLKEMDLALEAGKVHGLVGLNGSGKTTFLNCLCGMVHYQSGTISWQHQPLTKAHVAILETQNFFYKRITGREYLQLFRAFNPRFEMLLWNELFALPLDTFIEEYSTGMKKKLAFMSILSFDKPLLILDEPFNGVDMENVQLIKIIIAKLRAIGKTILITSHILESLINSCDTISYLHDQRIQRTFYPEDFSRIEEVLFDVTNKKNAQLVDRLVKPAAIHPSTNLPDLPTPP